MNDVAQGSRAEFTKIASWRSDGDDRWSLSQQKASRQRTVQS
jgi:hypothetical protein